MDAPQQTYFTPGSSRNFSFAIHINNFEKKTYLTQPTKFWDVYIFYYFTIYFFF